MRRVAAIVVKDLAQHGVVLVTVLGFLGLCWALITLTVLLQPATVTYLEAHATVTRFLVPLAGLALGNRLVVAEYQGRTQLFLEALPIGRLEVLAAKLLLGLVALETIALGSLAATLAVAGAREPIDALFVAILAARTSVLVLFLWSWFFAMGLLGRLRLAIYLAIGLVVAILASTTELELARFGPIALVADDFPLERTRWPTSALLVTLALSAGWLALAAVLASLREGSVAEALAKRMSLREQVTIGAFLVGALITWGELADPTARPPYRFPDDRVVRSRSLPIEIMYAPGEDARDDAEVLLARLERELGALREGLGWDRLPTIRVALAERLDGATFEPVEVGEDDGVLLRANYLRETPEWSEDAFVSEVVGRAIDDRTGGRALWEPIEWPRDGIAAWWPYRDRESLPDPIVLRALWATRERGPDAARLASWDRTLQREGERVGAGLAASGIQTLEDARGKDAVLALGRALYSDAPPDDFRAVVYGWTHPLPETLREATGLSERELIAAWTAWLRAQRARAELAPAIGALPYGEASVAFEPGEDGAQVLVGRAALGRAPSGSEGRTGSLLHLGIGPFDEYVWPHEPLREERAIGAGERTLEIRVAGRYGSGERVWASLDLEGTPLGVPARLAHARLEVP